MSFPNSGDPANCLDVYDNQALSNTAVQIGNDRGAGTGGMNVYGMLLQNNAAAATYFSFYDAASTGAPTVGTGAVFTVVVPANSTFYIAPERAKKHFVNGCFIAATTGRANATAPATAATVDVWYSQR